MQYNLPSKRMVHHLVCDIFDVVPRAFSFNMGIQGSICQRFYQACKIWCGWLMPKLMEESKSIETSSASLEKAYRIKRNFGGPSNPNRDAESIGGKHAQGLCQRWS